MSTPQQNWRTHGSTLRLVLAVVAIIIGVLIYVNAWKVGAGHKGFGVVEVTIGILAALTTY